MLSLLLLACAASDDTALPTLSTDEGRYEVTISTDPDPPLAGDATIRVEAPEATSLALDGTMVGMGHGFSREPVVTGGDGAFDVAVNFSMSGTWELTFSFDGAPGPDTLTTGLDVR